ncbi:uncharacterized protein PgNI_11991 [Pyricularia grisea]|uniref:Uncharacterized protein n=1 Tax=Pyricularia grisea TaxID=148305 RepID=A0A6P8AQE0_PYRGI|nr:uncharacterized protein PgNI_11991 [Pyricularia grisea]TLD04268.1 hypothetical protein PgNI_11991 [Pyricularia grisea]
MVKLRYSYKSCPKFYRHDLATFAQTIRHFSNLAFKKLYRQNAKSDRPMALICAAVIGKNRLWKRL